MRRGYIPAHWCRAWPWHLLSPQSEWSVHFCSSALGWTPWLVLADSMLVDMLQAETRDVPVWLGLSSYASATAMEARSLGSLLVTEEWKLWAPNRRKPAAQSSAQRAQASSAQPQAAINTGVINILLLYVPLRIYGFCDTGTQLKSSDLVTINELI